MALPVTVYEPATVTWPSGERVTFTREGQVVTALVDTGDSVQLSMLGQQPFPADYFKPFGSGQFLLTPDPRYALAVLDDYQGTTALTLVNFSDGPFTPGAVSWLAEDDTARAELIRRLIAYVTPGAHAAVADAAFAGECVDEALQLVARACGGTVVPIEIRDRAVIEAGSELFHRRQAPNGISQFAAPDGNPMRVARDPMNAARAILSPFLPLGFA